MSTQRLTMVSADETKLTAHGRKAIIAGGIGNAVEWVDWAVYTTFSSVFAHHFFRRRHLCLECYKAAAGSQSARHEA